MERTNLWRKIYILGSFCAVVFAQDKVVHTSRPSPTQDYVHHAELDEYGKYFLYWTFDDDTVTFEAHVKTLGWVGFGLSPNGGMPGSDIVIGWVDQNGKAYLSDRHATGTSKPVKDDSQDWTLLEGKEEGEFTLLKFTRKKVTCDDNDRNIGHDTTRAIFAWHDNDPRDEEDLKQHKATNRGTKSLQIIDYNAITANKHDKFISGINSFEMRVNNVSLPQQRTTYFCRIMALPKLTEKHQIIRIEPVLDNVPIVHHIIAYFCYGRLQTEEYGRICWEGNMPDNATECSTIAFGWAVGQDTFTLPDEVGLSIGSPGDPAFFQLEMHYDNPQNLSGIVVV